LGRRAGRQRVLCCSALVVPCCFCLVVPIARRARLPALDLLPAMLPNLVFTSARAITHQDSPSTAAGSWPAACRAAASCPHGRPRPLP
jgi:hypothetical protein